MLSERIHKKSKPQSYPLRKAYKGRMPTLKSKSKIFENLCCYKNFISRQTCTTSRLSRFIIITYKFLTINLMIMILAFKFLHVACSLRRNNTSSDAKVLKLNFKKENQQKIAKFSQENNADCTQSNKNTSKKCDYLPIHDYFEYDEIVKSIKEGFLFATTRSCGFACTKLDYKTITFNTLESEKNTFLYLLRNAVVQEFREMCNGPKLNWSKNINVGQSFQCYQLKNEIEKYGLKVFCSSLYNDMCLEIFICDKSIMNSKEFSILLKHIRRNSIKIIKYKQFFEDMKKAIALYLAICTVATKNPCYFLLHCLAEITYQEIYSQPGKEQCIMYVESFLREENLIFNDDNFHTIIQYIKNLDENDLFFRNIKSEISNAKDHILKTFRTVNFESDGSLPDFKNLILCLKMLKLNGDHLKFRPCLETLIIFLLENFPNCLSNKNIKYDILSKKIIANNIDFLLKNKDLYEIIRKIYNLKLEETLLFSSTMTDSINKFLLKDINQEKDFIVHLKPVIKDLIDTHKINIGVSHYTFLCNQKHINNILLGFITFGCTKDSKNNFKTLNTCDYTHKYFQLSFLFKKKIAEKILENLKNQKICKFFHAESFNQTELHNEHLKTVFYREWDHKIIKPFNGLEIDCSPRFNICNKDCRVVFSNQVYRKKNFNDKPFRFAKISENKTPFELIFLQDISNFNKLHSTVIVFNEYDIIKIYFCFNNYANCKEIHKLRIHKQKKSYDHFSDRKKNITCDNLCYSIRNEKFSANNKFSFAFIKNFVAALSYFCVNQPYIVQAILSKNEPFDFLRDYFETRYFRTVPMWKNIFFSYYFAQQMVFFYSTILGFEAEHAKSFRIEFNISQTTERTTLKHDTLYSTAFNPCLYEFHSTIRIFEKKIKEIMLYRKSLDNDFTHESKFRVETFFFVNKVYEKNIILSILAHLCCIQMIKNF